MPFTINWTSYLRTRKTGPTQCGKEAGMLAKTNSLCHSPPWSIDWGSWQKSECVRRPLLGLWSRIFPFGGHLLVDIIKASPFTEGHKMILKCETPIMSRMVLEKRPNKDGSAQESSVSGSGSGLHTGSWCLPRETGTSFSLGLTLRPWEKLWEPTAVQTVPCEQLSAEPHRAGCLVCGRRFQGEWTSVYLKGHPPPRRKKVENKSALCAEMHLFSQQWQKKCPRFQFLPTPRQWPNGQPRRHNGNMMY